MHYLRLIIEVEKPTFCSFFVPRTCLQIPTSHAVFQNQKKAYCKIFTIFKKV